MFNPFQEKIAADEDDRKLIVNALAGNVGDLEKIILRHQAWIYNIALKMVLDPADAEDVTQEILIKMVTRLSTFNPARAAFRTWLYRIVVNHTINMKKRKYERFFNGSLAEYERAVANIPDQTIEGLPERTVLLEELKIKCWTSMLLCLQREQRIVFILGDIFEVSDRLGSSLLEISAENFRRILSRSRKKIFNFMGHNCGLIDDRNPCHCDRKLKGFIRNGFLNPDRISYFTGEAAKIKDAIGKSIDAVNRHGNPESINFFLNHPFYDPPGFNDWMIRLLAEGRVNLSPQIQA